jgi:HEXXH motif-containing protein
MARLFQELARIGSAMRLSAPARADLASFQLLIRRLVASSPGALASVLRRPTIGTLIRCLRREGPEEWLAELIALVHFELALCGALPAPARLLCLPPRLLSIPAGVSVSLPGDVRAAIFENGHLHLLRQDRQDALDLDMLAAAEDPPPAWPPGIEVRRPYRPLGGTLSFALEDNNPLALLEAHPDKTGNAIDLGGHAETEWAATLQGALALIEAHLPDLRREMDIFIHQIIPVGWDDVQHLSASYQEAIGTIYLTLHPSLMTMAEALIHEFSHNKLNALFETDPVLENAFSPLYSSPVRPDPRPLHGVLLAVHAFLPVARLYEKMIEAKHPLSQNAAFEDRFARIREINAEGAQVVLSHGRPTEVGAGLLEEIRRWDDYYASQKR